MEILKKYVVFDAPDIDVEAEFWAAVLGGRVANVENPDEERWRDVVVNGAVALAVQYAPDFQAPVWPAQDNGVQRQQLHLDLFVQPDAVDSSQDEVLALGARLLRTAEVVPGEHGFRVFSDPAGHPFCICWG